MRSTVIILPLVVMLAIGQSFAQYDEICHYECGIIYCDPYTDYCDYDCYEVCYPYRSHTTGSRLPMLGLKTFSPFRMQTTTQSPVTHHGPSSPAQTRSENGARPSVNGRTGKGVRMRIQRVPKPQLANVLQSKEYSRPENFALFQSCTI